MFFRPVIYFGHAEIFNKMKYIQIGMKMYLIDNDKQRTK